MARLENLGKEEPKTDVNHNKVKKADAVAMENRRMHSMLAFI